MTLSSPTPLTRSRGMRDLLPAQMRAFRLAEDAFCTAAARWGYAEIRTPTIETYSLFTWLGALGPDMLARVYSFLDWDGWSGERVVLRPDSTIPVVRAVREGNLGLPVRLAYVQNVFRFTPDDAERETWQFGLEHLGAPASVGEVEVLLVAHETLSALGIDVTLRLSHAGLIGAVARATNGSGAGPASSHDVIAGAREDSRLRPIAELLTTTEGDVGLLRNLAALAGDLLPDAAAPIAELEALTAVLGELGVPYRVAPALALDFEYYSGVTFELTAGDAVLGSGGRYSPPGEGEPATACGLALDADALVALLAPRTEVRRAVAVVAVTAGDVARALAVTRELHRHGLSAVPAPGREGRPVAVLVEGDRLAVATPEGERTAASVEDLLRHLLQYK